MIGRWFQSNPQILDTYALFAFIFYWWHIKALHNCLIWCLLNYQVDEPIKCWTRRNSSEMQAVTGNSECWLFQWFSVWILQHFLMMVGHPVWLWNFNLAVVHVYRRKRHHWLVFFTLWVHLLFLELLNAEDITLGTFQHFCSAAPMPWIFSKLFIGSFYLQLVIVAAIALEVGTFIVVHSVQYRNAC